MSKKADLHVHTNFSDGTCSPQEVVKNANQLGISCIAITDHDCVDGIEPAMEEGEKLGIEIIPGVELTAEIKDEEIHILGYFIDWKTDWFIEELNKFCKLRVERITEMIKRLEGIGIHIEPKEVFELSGRGSVGRLHLAKIMHEKGVVSSIYDAFKQYIGFGKSCYVKKFNLTPKQAIEMIKKIGGVSVLAHPKVMGKDEFIQDYVNWGLAGIEVYHSDHNQANIQHYKELAEKFGLLITGGSDCHGLAKGKLLMGRVTVPYEIVEQLKEVAQHK